MSDTKSFDRPDAAVRIIGGMTRLTHNASTIEKTEASFRGADGNISRFCADQKIDAGPAGRRLVEAGLSDRNDPRMIAMQEPLDADRVKAFTSTSGLREEGMKSLSQIESSIGRGDRDMAMRLKAILKGIRAETPSRNGLATAFGEVSVLAGEQGHNLAAEAGARTFAEMTQAGVDVERSRSRRREAAADAR
jgi:hypothetical protein